MYFLGKYYSELKHEIELVRVNIDSFENLKWAFRVLLSIYVFSTLSIIRADFLYRDDIGRKALGYIEWENFSRYISVFLSQILHTSGYLGDISPLPQYLAMLIIVGASLIVIMIFKTDKKLTFWDIVAVLPLGLSPYFLECLSFKYDAPYMALSVFGSVLPMLFYYSPQWIFLFVTVIGILISCNTYQASLGIFPMLVIFVSVKKYFEHKDNTMICEKILGAFLGYLFAILFYKIVILHPHPGYNYVNTDMLAYNDLLRGMFDNYKHYFQLIYDDFEPIYKIMIVYLCGCYVLQPVGYKTKQNKTKQNKTKQNKTKSLLVSVLALSVSALLMFGPYVAIVQPIFLPRAMYGLGAWLTFIALTCVTMSSTKVPKMVVLCLGWCFIVFTFLYGNALKEQDRFTRFRMEQMIMTLTSIDDFKRNHLKIVQFDGEFGRSPVILNMPQNKYVLSRLIPGNSTVYDWGAFSIFHYYGLEKMKFLLPSENNDFRKHNLALIKETYYEKIYHQGNEWFIELK